MLIVVVLPAPFGPTSPTISPGATWKLMASTARKSPNDLAMRSTESTGGEGESIGPSYPPGSRARQAGRGSQGCPVPPDEP